MVQAVSGKLRILRDGNRIGFALRPKHRQRFLSAVQHGYLAESPESGPLVDAFLWWCEAGEIPCVRFQVERECISFTGHENPAEDPHVSLHFSMATRGRILTKTGVPAVAGILAGVQRGAIRVTTLESARPSPFAASLLFAYVANYIYDGDAPLAERRAQALSIDQSQLEELLGDTDLRELLDATALDEVESRLQSLEPDYKARHADGVHDLLLKLGDLSDVELVARCESA